MRDRSLALDEQGHPHLAFGRYNLNYARFDGSEWHQELVDDFQDAGVVFLPLVGR